MKKKEIRDWVIQSFKPVTLSVPMETLDQIVDASILYWNTHSGYKIVRMFDAPTLDDRGRGALQLSSEVKTVVHCYPSTMQEELFSNHPMWILLGFITLDKYTQDLMLLSHTFEGYRIYLGNDFRWKWIRSDDSTKGGWLFVQQTPRGSSKFAIVGTKRVIDGEDITDEFIFGWIREHARATTKVFEGNVLRHAQIIGIANSGQVMVDEGTEEKKILEDKLRQEARWMMMPVRR